MSLIKSAAENVEQFDRVESPTPAAKQVSVESPTPAAKQVGLKQVCLFQRSFLLRCALTTPYMYMYRYL